MEKEKELPVGFSNEIREEVFSMQNGICKHCLDPIQDFHHSLRNTKANRRLFHLFINSPLNCVGLCRECHTNKSHLYRIKNKEATIYENYLTCLLKY